jgi:hypothetical protein
LEVGLLHVDFLVKDPAKIKEKVNIPDLLKDLGFIVSIENGGYVRLNHADLILELLVEEKSTGTEKPVNIRNLGMNAIALRFLNFLSSKTIKVKVEDFVVTLPHPAVFALHKVIVSQRRDKSEKALKDMQAAIYVLKSLVEKGDISLIKESYSKALPSWKKKIQEGLRLAGEEQLLARILG